MPTIPSCWSICDVGLNFASKDLVFFSERLLWQDGRLESTKGQEGSCPSTARWVTADWNNARHNYATLVHMDGNELIANNTFVGDYPPKFTCEYLGRNVALGK